MLSLYMDQHVPASITRALLQRGLDVITAHDDGRAEAEDRVILDRATELGRVVFTRDRDFLALGRAAQSTGVEFSGIIDAHQLQVTIGQAVRDLEMICHSLTWDEIRSQVLFLPI
jgi:predicted nuclease of predicted toxin-antitoxin system